MLLLLLSAVLSACNLPQPTSGAPGTNSQRQTEIAGILNPEEFGTVPTETATLPPADRAGFTAYTTQQGDTLPALALRFGVMPAAIQSDQYLPPEGLLSPGLQLWVPDALADVLPPATPFFPDSEVIYGPSVGDFNAADFAFAAGGFLADYTETVREETLTGPEIVQTVAIETSTNPRLLLAFLEYRSGWVFGHPTGAASDPYPLGFGAGADTGLYRELMISAKLLAQGFYGWRDGSLTDVVFPDGETRRLTSGLNAGSTALLQLFTALYPQETWSQRLLGPDGFLAFYAELFGDLTARAALVEPYLLADTQQPELTLPFAVGKTWSLTGGPHLTWQTGTPRGAVDFAPITGEATCAVSTSWATAAAPGLVVRSARGVVALDLDGDGDEGTGWVLVYLHIAEKDRAATGTWLAQDARVGHPSCEGGQSTGTHVHLARKFNGEWLGVGGPLPLVLSGWQAFAGEGRYEGQLVKGELIVTASPNGVGGSAIKREE